MRRILLFVYLFLIALTATTARANLHGGWHASLDSVDDKLHLSLMREHNQFGRSYAVTDFTGLTEAQLRATGSSPLKFSLVREAGTFSFDGVFGDGEGGGKFTFTPNPRYLDEMRRLGVTPGPDVDDDRLFSLAALDVSTAFVREMQSLGYRGALEDFVRFRIHGVTPDFVRAMQAAGYRELSAEDLVRFRIHGVTPEYVRTMQELGYKLTSEDLVRFRIHGVTPELVRTLTTLGYRNLSGEDLVRFRIHGVTSDYLHELKSLGYTPTADELVRMRIHSVTGEFIRSLKSAGYENIPVEKLIEMRIHGIDAKYLKAVNR